MRCARGRGAQPILGQPYGFTESGNMHPPLIFTPALRADSVDHEFAFGRSNRTLRPEQGRSERTHPVGEGTVVRQRSKELERLYAGTGGHPSGQKIGEIRIIRGFYGRNPGRSFLLVHGKAV